MSTPLRFAYFGGEPLGVPVLNQLEVAGLLPSLIVASPDRPAGRNLTLTPPAVKVWAAAKGIPVFQPETLDNNALLAPLIEGGFDLFVVVAYNKILPEWLITLPTHKTINVHPSLLPQYRGPSPIRTAILEDNPGAVGVSIMLMDSAMDHGPIIATKAHPIAEAAWPTDGVMLDNELADVGGKLLAQTIPLWRDGACIPVMQDDAQATYTKKFTRADGELMLDPHALPTGDRAWQTLLKIRAFAGWPGTFFTYQHKRVKIQNAHVDEMKNLVIETVTPEGKPLQSFAHYLASLRS